MGGFLINGCGASDSYYKIKDVAHSFCPSCNAMRTFALMELRMKIRVLWIPTVPISKKYAVVCPVCKSGYYVDEQQKDDILYERVQVEVVKDGVILRKKNEPQRIPQPTPTPQPVPQPMVSPVPRSHSRILMRPWSTIWAKVTLVRRGKQGRCSAMGPYWATSSPAVSSTSSTVWGLPQDREEARNIRSPTWRGWSKKISPSVRTGTCSARSSGFPMAARMLTTLPFSTISSTC